MKLSRRNFLKRGALFVPAPFAILRARAQSMNAADGPFIAAGPTTFELLTLSGFGGNRNNTTSELGGIFTRNNDGVTLRAVALGRYVISGNNQTHTIKLFNGSCVLQGSVSLNTTGLSTGVHYVALGSAISLVANGVYYLSSTETNGGDNFADGAAATSAKATNIALVTTNGGCSAPGTAGFVWPVNILYTF